MAELSISQLVHSIRIYDGSTEVERVSYRIGDTFTELELEKELFYDTWDDFHLIPASRPTVALPSSNTKLVNIPGNKTPIDLTTYLTGHETFGNRTGSWSFLTDVEYVDQYLGGWIAFDKRLRSLFHGHIGKIVLRDDPSYFYVGELTMGPWQTGASRSSVTISYDLYPYKKSMYSTMDLWRFDDFDFRDGFIMYAKDLEVTSSRDVILYGGRERISPHISGSSNLVIYKEENSELVNYGYVSSANISSNETIVPRLVIGEGKNRLQFRGNGTVTIDYRRGLL